MQHRSWKQPMYPGTWSHLRLTRRRFLPRGEEREDLVQRLAKEELCLLAVWGDDDKLQRPRQQTADGSIVRSGICWRPRCMQESRSGFAMRSPIVRGVTSKLDLAFIRHAHRRHAGGSVRIQQAQSYCMTMLCPSWPGPSAACIIGPLVVALPRMPRPAQ